MTAGTADTEARVEVVFNEFEAAADRSLNGIDGRDLRAFRRHLCEELSNHRRYAGPLSGGKAIYGADDQSDSQVGLPTGNAAKAHNRPPKVISGTPDTVYVLTRR